MIKFSKLVLSLCSAVLFFGISSFELFAQSPVACPGFRTWTQGGYGASSNGAPTQFLTANFAAAFPAGLEIGCTNKIRLTTATAVRNFLPQGTAPAYLNSGIATNPTKTNFNSVLAGQLVTLTLNVRFDQVFASFGSSSTNLRDLVITTGPFLGWTVQQFLDDANKKIGGCSSISTASYSDYNNAADRINRAYDNGVSSGSFLACPMSISCSTAPARCFNTATGSMTVSVSGGVPPYSVVSWSNGASGSFNGTLSATASNLLAGSYTAVVRDASGKQLSTTCTVTEPTQLVASSSAGTILCNGGTTTVSVSATGGRAPYSGTGTFTVGAGTYSYTVTDANGCQSTTSITVSQPDQLVASSSAGTILCYGGTTTVSVSAIGGTAPYSGTGEFTVGAGTYSYTVTDANGCESTTSVTVTEPTQLVASSSAGTILCNGGTTTVSVSANGGTAPYSGTGEFTIGAGTYSYTVTDANGCESTTSVTVTEPAQLVASSSADEIVCFGGTTTITVSANGGTTPYDGTGNFTVGAGDYSYTVTDANGCQAATSISISQPDEITVTNTNRVASLCTSSPCDGYAEVMVSGGAGSYIYDWTASSATVTENGSRLDNLCGGEVYSVVITDGKGCAKEYVFPQPHLDCTGGCEPLRTYTQGGWGAVPNGNNPGVYLHANFDAAFPSGLTIGCSSNTLSFYSAQEITDFLPKGGTPDELPVLSVLTGQLLAASLSVGFDAHDANFAASEGSLGGRVIQSGPYAGTTVSEILAIANDAIGGCSASVDLSALNAALTAINENYDNGNTDNGFLGCSAPALSGRVATEFNGELFPNPAIDASTLKLVASHGESINVLVSDFMGRILFESNSTTTQGINEVKLPLAGVSAKQCIVRVTKGAESFTKILHIGK
jgi:hypothetical protein